MSEEICFLNGVGPAAEVFFKDLSICWRVVGTLGDGVVYCCGSCGGLSVCATCLNILINHIDYLSSYDCVADCLIQVV